MSKSFLSPESAADVDGWFPFDLSKDLVGFLKDRIIAIFEV